MHVDVQPGVAAQIVSQVGSGTAPAGWFRSDMGDTAWPSHLQVSLFRGGDGSPVGFDGFDETSGVFGSGHESEDSDHPARLVRMPAWFTPFLLLLDALAVFRLTWLVTQDTVPFGSLRDRLDRERPDSKLTELVNCPWCVSVWLAPTVLGAHALLPGVWPYIAVVLAFSAVAGLLASLV